jgi:hypothetical protein
MNRKTALILGDILAIAVVTIIGFVAHGEAEFAFIPRMAAAFFPLVIAWFLLAPWFGLFQPGIASGQIWRPALAMFFAAPFAAVLRGLILNAPVIPLFAMILGVTSASGMLLWRILWKWINRSWIS